MPLRENADLLHMVKNLECFFVFFIVLAEPYILVHNKIMNMEKVSEKFSVYELGPGTLILFTLLHI